MTETRPVPSTAPKQTQAVCYGCGKLGHIRPECPLHRGNPRAAVARMDEVEEGNPVEDYPEAEGQEGDPPVPPLQSNPPLDYPPLPCPYVPLWHVVCPDAVGIWA